jgi:hypothetical protein
VSTWGHNRSWPAITYDGTNHFVAYMGDEYNHPTPYDVFGWGAPGSMDTSSGWCNIKPEVTFEYRDEATQGLYA